MFLDRHDTPTFLSTNTDVVVSHQWENPLNYFYLEVCWQGFPLVHTAHLCKELGYYYNTNDVTQASQQLRHALTLHADVAEQYRQDQRQHITRFLPDNTKLVAAYTQLLERLKQKPLR